MNHPTDNETKKRGARRHLDQPERLTTNITAAHRERLDEYCRRCRISTAEAIRRAIDLLTD